MDDSSRQFRIEHRAAIERLLSRGTASRWHFGADAIADVLRRAAESSKTSASDVDGLIDTLHAEDLILACACRAGIDGAWEELIARYRSVLYASGRAIAGDEHRGRELADSLYGDLFGLEVRDGRRRSLLDYFHGRSSLATWLRAVMAQRHIDAVRSSKNSVPLEDDLEDGESASDGDSIDRARYVHILGAALDAALAILKPFDRVLLAYYYRHRLTLREISKIVGEHESTVSRRLHRTRAQIRKQVERTLRRESRLSEDQIALCYRYASEDLPLDLARALPDTEIGAKESAPPVPRESAFGSRR